MKKLLALLLALLMALSLAACSADEEEDTSGRRKKKNTEPTTVTEEPTEYEEESCENEAYSAYTVFEQLGIAVVDNDDVTITIGQPEVGDWDDVVCSVEVTNNSKELLHVYPMAVAVNGKMVSGYFSVDVEKNRTETDKLEFYELKGPENLTRLSLLLNVADEEYNCTGYLLDIYPQGRKAHKESVPGRAGVDVLFDQGGLYMGITAWMFSDNFSPQLQYLAFNDSNQAYDFSLEALAINGFNVVDYSSNTILPDTYADQYIDLFSHDDLCALGMEPNEITSVLMEICVENMDLERVYCERGTLYPKGEQKAQTVA